MLPLHALTSIFPVTPAGSSTHRQTGGASLLNALMPGQRLRGTVRASLSGTEGEFLLTVDTLGGRGGSQGADAKGPDQQALHVKLPRNTRPGDVLEMILVSREPKPVFVLAAHVPGADPSPLSLTGRFISDLLGRSVLQTAPAVSAAALPLLPAPPADGVQLTRNLADALGRSGLFYESHLAQWLSGTRTLAELALEPQSRLSPFLRLFPARSQPESLPAPPRHEDGAPHPAAGGQGDESTVRDPVHPEAQSLVRQQLETLETRQAAWQGVAWPGQSMEWEVAGEDKPHTPAEAEGSPAWRSCLKLTLPSLGQVCASLRLDPGGVDVRILAIDPVSAFMLRSGITSLAEALEAAGIRLVGMKVDLDGTGIDKG